MVIVRRAFQHKNNIIEVPDYVLQPWWKNKHADVNKKKVDSYGVHWAFQENKIRWSKVHIYQISTMTGSLLNKSARSQKSGQVINHMTVK